MTKIINKSYVAAANYRYVEDVMKDLDKLAEDVEDAMNLLRISTKEVAALFNIRQADIKDSPPLKGPVHLKLKPSDVTKLRNQYSVTKMLHDTLQTLDVMESKILLSFPKDGKERQRALNGLQDMRKLTLARLNEAYQFLANLGKKNAPASFTRFVADMLVIIEKSIQYERADEFLYLFEDEGCLAFTEYVHLKDLTDELGGTHRSLFVVLSQVIDPDGSRFYVGTMKDFEPPSHDILQKKVIDAKTGAKALNLLLSLDGVSNAIGALPINLLVKPQKGDFSLFHAGALISNLEVTPEGPWIFTLKPTVKEQVRVNLVMQSIYKDLQGLMRRTNARLRNMGTTQTGPNKSWQIKLALERPSGAPMADASDVEFLKTRFGLDDTAVKQILKLINAA